MSDRKNPLLLGVETLLGGRSLDVVGMRGSGRTLLLAGITDRLGDEGWRTLWIRGNASLVGTPFGALQTAGLPIGSSKTGMPPLTVAFEALLAEAGDTDFAFIIDNWNDLDESSWGAIQAARERSNHPIALSRLKGRPSQQTPTGLHAGTSASAFVVNIEALRFDELKRMVEGRVGGVVDPAVLSHIYAKSGGLAGIATVMVEAGLIGGRLMQRQGVWHATQGLWSDALSGISEEYLEPLNSAERDAVALIALAGTSYVELIRQVVGWEVLESLESYSLLRTHPSGGQHLVTLYPPILADYLRSLPTPLQRVRLTDVLLNELGTEPAEVGAADTPARRPETEDDAVFARLIHDQSQARLHMARAEWKRHPSAATGTDLVRSLLTDGNADKEIEDVFSTPLKESTDYVTEANFLSLHAEWRALGSGGLATALQLLSNAPEHWGAARRITDAWSVTLSCTLAQVPDNYATVLEITPGLPASVEIALLQAQIHVFIAVGRFRAAISASERFETLSVNEPEHIPDAMYGVALLGIGDADRARSHVKHGFEKARSALDLEAMRSHAAVLVYLFECEGLYDDADEILNSVFTGRLPPRKLASLSANTVMEVTAALIASRRGKDTEARSILHFLGERDLPDGPLPHQNSAIAKAQVLVNEDDVTAAADLLWARGTTLISRGLTFAGVLTQLASIEVRPDAERLQAVRPSVSVFDGNFVSIMHEFLEFVAGQSWKRAEDLSLRLVSTGRSGYAIAVAELASRRAFEASEDTQGQELLRFKSELATGLPEGKYEVARFNSPHSTLSDRESEVAFMIADGLKNPQIAEVLVLSVRTVETHIRRILKKLGARDRREIVTYINGRR